MRAIRGAPLHLLPIDVRAGTTYHDRAERRGLLEGGFLWRRYRFADPRTAVLAEVITGLPSRLEEHSVPLALYDLAYNLGVARRLVPGLVLAHETESYARISDAWNADQLRILEAAMQLASRATWRRRARSPPNRSPACGGSIAALMEDAKDALRAVEEAVRAKGRRHARVHTRGQLLSAVAFSMALAGCGRPLVTSGGGTAPPAPRRTGPRTLGGRTNGPGRDLVFYDAACDARDRIGRTPDFDSRADALAARASA